MTPASSSQHAAAVLKVLQERHASSAGALWSNTSGVVRGEYLQTPPGKCWGEPILKDGHSDSFPEKFYDEVVRAERWVDLTSLSPPDGKFEDALRRAITNVAQSGREVSFRVLFGNLPFGAVDTDSVLKSLIRDVPSTSKVKVWVGSYRKGVSWNHSKICAVDGRYLIQGGHNMWTKDYLEDNPVHDLSMEVEGTAAVSAHKYVDCMWQWFIDTAKGKICQCISNESRYLAIDLNLSHHPESASRFPPLFSRASNTFSRKAEPIAKAVPMISIGRLGAIGENPADDALVALIGSAKKSLKFSLQNIGPMKVAGVSFGDWPFEYLKAIARCMMNGVLVYLVMSNPNSGPSGGYGYGWKLVDIFYKLSLAVKDVMPELSDEAIDDAIEKYCRAVHIRRKAHHPAGDEIANHAKFFVVDDCCYYLGSQNLYDANLSEWGLVVDDKSATRKVLSEYWDPMWAESSREQKAVSVKAALGRLRAAIAEGEEGELQNFVFQPKELRLSRGELVMGKQDSLQPMTKRDTETGAAQYAAAHRAFAKRTKNVVDLPSRVDIPRRTGFLTALRDILAGVCSA